MTFNIKYFFINEDKTCQIVLVCHFTLTLLAIKLSLHIHNYFNVQRSTKRKENTAYHFVSNEHYQALCTCNKWAVRLFGQVHKIEKAPSVYFNTSNLQYQEKCPLW